MSDRPSRLPHAVIAAVFALTALAACIELSGARPDLPRHSWWDERGPVVPHDSFPTDCSACHDAGSWDTVRADFEFDHLAQTGVALDGAHAEAQCLRCHNDRGPVQLFASRGCTGCHEDVHQSQLGDTCSSCHSEDNWLPVGQVAEHAATRFPLVGAHAAVACFACHERAQVQRFDRADTACVSCHSDDLASTSDPDHLIQGWVDDCDRCHTPVAWQGAGFDHGFFPLVGGHAAANCNDCHTGGNFVGTPNDCVSCHQDDYDGTDDPPHMAAGFPTDCQQCHTPFNWGQGGFSHAFFPLTGAHAATDCTQCHQGGVYIGTPNDCASCHIAEYDATDDPPHMAAGFPTDCEQCHTTSGWGGADFNHGFFPLTGAHAGTDCTQCHQGGVYIGTPTSCVACHVDEYMNTSDPDHIDAGFPDSCEQCHSTSSWDGATFDHSSFPLTGSHALVDCQQCHEGGVFIGTRSDCFSCHQDDYDDANDPDHNALGFPTNCEQCHNTSDWDDAVFNHSFPIETGKHKNLDCLECHTVPGNLAVFSCTDCHAHTKSEMDDKHIGEVNNYVYQTAACYSCHPDGKEDD